MAVFLHQLSDALVRFGPYGVLLLAGLDSLGVPLPAAVDALLIYVSWHSPRQAWFTAGMAVLGSLAGNCALYWGARHGLRRLVKPPTPGRPQKFRQWFHRYGLVTVFIPALLPFPPMPLKIFVLSAGILHTPSSHFLAVILLARGARYFGEAYLGTRLGRNAQAFLSQNAWSIAVASALVIVLLFVLVRLNDRRRNRHSEI